MGNVVLVISMSLDGFVAGANIRLPDAPLGEGGEQLHDWLMHDDDPRNREVLERGIASAGAVITGRRTYDTSIEGWGIDGPTGDTRLPVFVISHSVPQDVPKGGVYVFVHSIEEALAKAQAAAGDKIVSVMGGANVAQQFIRAGLIDEIQIHLVPVLFGSGARLFDALGSQRIQLANVNAVQTAAVTHLRFRVVK